MPESNPLDGVLPDGFHSVTVCAILSLFVHLTVVPLGKSIDVCDICSIIVNYLCYVETVGSGSEDCEWVDGIPEPTL
jgi:hypothetical protein